MIKRFLPKFTSNGRAVVVVEHKQEAWEEKKKSRGHEGERRRRQIEIREGASIM